HRIRDEPLEPGTWVLVHETWLDNQHGNKGALRWAGPYVIVQRHPSGSYSLRELDGTLLKESVSGSRLKLFYFRDHDQSMTAAAAADVSVVAAPDTSARVRFCGTQIDGRTLNESLKSNDDGGFDVTWVLEDHVVDKACTRERHRTNIDEILRAQSAVLPWPTR
ncbi:uncharacterized protein PHACADRAFT_102853, partial [Phanerochaete carnosa HHB-10118-sp]